MSGHTPGPRTVASLSRLEKQWMRGKFCGWCEAPMLGAHCYAQFGWHELPVMEGVRGAVETVDLGPQCNMDAQRGRWLQSYKARAAIARARGEV